MLTLFSIFTAAMYVDVWITLFYLGFLTTVFVFPCVKGLKRIEHKFVK